MAWIILVLAGLVEIGWAVGLKYTEGFTRILPSIFTAASMVTSLVLLGVAMKSIPLGIAYAIWTGIGIVGAAVAGAVLFGETMPFFRLVSIGLIVAGIVGLKITTA